MISQFLEESIVASQKNVNGAVRCRVYKGQCYILGRSSETSKLYDESMASMDEIGDFAPVDSSGFITVQAIRLKKVSVFPIPLQFLSVLLIFVK